MPKQQPVRSWNEIRNYAELFEWRDAKTGVTVRGYNPPGGKDGKGVQRVPFHVKYITINGEVEQGLVVCLKVYPELRQRMIQYVESRQIRRIRDYLIMEIDGVRIVTH
jgi:hypothetical protein